MKPSSSSCYKVGIITLAILMLFQINSCSSAGYDNKVLNPDHYLKLCPKFYQITWKTVNEAIEKEARMGASLLRLHFHDCFVNGCDGSVLLDDTPKFKGEKGAAGNMNSIRGFEVIDSIKAQLEDACPNVASCADILAYAAMTSVAALGGPVWWVELGRFDWTTASQGDANHSLPSPASDFKGLISNFTKVGLTQKDVVTLSGAHTIGQAQCQNFRKRLYNEGNTINGAYAQHLKLNCPRNPGPPGDKKLAPLDYTTDVYFDSNYYNDVLEKKSLLHSDNQLSLDRGSLSMVTEYSKYPSIFWSDFVNAMVRMGQISHPATGTGKGEIRKNCRKANR